MSDPWMERAVRHYVAGKVAYLDRYGWTASNEARYVALVAGEYRLLPSELDAELDRRFPDTTTTRAQKS